MLKKWSGVLASWLVVVSLCYAVLEVTVMQWLPRTFPLASVLNYLDADAQLLAQYSKHSTLPENYIAILGDSYAFGQGDWLYQQQSRVAPDFSAAHLLYAETGRDVVSFGKPASSNIKGYLEDPLSQLAYLRRAVKQPVGDPETAVLYFYEGNDVVDNWQDYQVRFLGSGRQPAQLQDPAVFTAFVDQRILAENRAWQRAQAPALTDRLWLAGFLCKLMVGESLRLADAVRQRVAPRPHKPIFKPQARDTNTVLVGDRAEKIPDGLQVPPLALEGDEEKVALQVLAQTLRQLRQRWPQTRVGVVYVPAVATSYRIVSPVINIYDTARGKAYASDGVLPASDATCRAVAGIVQAQGMAFVDTRPAARHAAAQQFLHGPVDWLHFNEAGYRLLAAEISRLLLQMQQGAPPDRCAELASSE